MSVDPPSVALPEPGPLDLWLWRHPRPRHAAGRCIGRTDLAVDPRRAKRLAHRIRRVARQQRLPQIIWSSPLRRCARVGQWLAQWGWQHHLDARLLELDFGAWEGRPWADIPPSEVATWEAAFGSAAPGGGEPLQALADRCQHFMAERRDDASGAVLVVAHAGWMLASAGMPTGGWLAHRWPAAPPCGALVRRALPAAQRPSMPLRRA